MLLLLMLLNWYF